MKNLLLTVVLLFIFTACNTQRTLADISSVNQTDQVNFEKKRNVLIDVRTPEEYNESHIPGAINISVLSEDFDSEIEKLDKNKNYYLYCKSGKRSTKAFEKMEESGFKHLSNLKDGFGAYQKKEENEQ